jgi:hypothetical protein
VEFAVTFTKRFRSLCKINSAHLIRTNASHFFSRSHSLTAGLFPGDDDKLAFGGPLPWFILESGDTQMGSSLAETFCSRRALLCFMEFDPYRIGFVYCFPHFSNRIAWHFPTR